MSNTKVRIVMICWSVAMVTALSCYRPTPPKVTVMRKWKLLCRPNGRAALPICR